MIAAAALVVIASAAAVNAAIMPIRPIAPQALIKSGSKTFTYQGCYIDGEPRFLEKKMPGVYTNVKCSNACVNAGYIVAGTENGGECWCGMTLQTISRTNGVKVADSECNMACQTSNQPCGGRRKLTVYSSKTPLTKLDAPKTLKIGQKCWTYVGCFADNVNHVRILPKAILNAANKTLEGCGGKAGGLYKFFGGENGGECFVGINDPTTTPVDDAFCNYPCDGNHNEACGGQGYITVYTEGNCTTTTTTSKTSTTTSSSSSSSSSSISATTSSVSTSTSTAKGSYDGKDSTGGSGYSDDGKKDGSNSYGYNDDNKNGGSSNGGYKNTDNGKKDGTSGSTSYSYSDDKKNGAGSAGGYKNTDGGKAGTNGGNRYGNSTGSAKNQDYLVSGAATVSASVLSVIAVAVSLAL